MLALEIVVGIAAVLIVVLVFGKYIYNRIKGIDEECSICKNRSKKIIKNIKKELVKETNE